MEVARKGHFFMYPELSKFDRFAYDTETTGLNPMGGDRVFGFSISTPDGKDYYYDVRKQPKSVEWLNDSLKQYHGSIICHNLSFDYRFSKVSGINIPLDRCVDTCIQACLINEHETSYSLDYLAKKYTKDFKKGDQLYSDLAGMFGGRATRNVQMKNISNAPEEIVAPYAKADTRATLALFDWQCQEIERQKLWDIITFERGITPLLIDSEMHGIRVDTLAAEMAIVELNSQIKVLQSQLDGIAGFKCNPQPSKDIAKLFNPQWKENRWWACDGTPLDITDAGNPKLDSDALRIMSHPAAAVILELRSLIKTRDTFLGGHVLESAINGRVYPTINQCKGDSGGTSTGRLSYSGPAMQQIPDRNKKVAQVVKKVFLPDEGQIWVDADMASFEVRIFGHLVATSEIIKAYKDNPETDFHGFVANLTNLVRNATYSGQPNAKQLNLSMIFNQGNGTTAEKMNMPWSWESFTAKDGKEVVYKKAGLEAMRIIETYHNAMPGVKKLAEGAKAVAEQRGWVFTRYGRRLRFPNGFKSYKASGLLIQATSADENKKNWMLINESLKGTGGRMILNTHDSYSLSLPKDEAEKLARDVKNSVEKDRGLRVPLILEVQKPGHNWWESKSNSRWM